MKANKMVKLLSEESEAKISPSKPKLLIPRPSMFVMSGNQSSLVLQASLSMCVTLGKHLP